MIGGVLSGALSAWIADLAPRLLARARARFGRIRGRRVAPPSAWLAGAVHRWHTHPLLAATRDRVDGHSARVAVLILQFMPNAPAALLRAAVTHDLGESATGDLASPVKRAFPDLYAAVEILEGRALERMGLPLPDLTADQAALLRLCDGLDSYLWALHHCPDLVARHPAWRAQLARLRGSARDLGFLEKFDEICAGVRGGKV